MVRMHCLPYLFCCSGQAGGCLNLCFPDILKEKGQVREMDGWDLSARMKWMILIMYLRFLPGIWRMKAERGFWKIINA